MPLYLQSLVGFVALFVLAWTFSEKRPAVMWRTVLGAIALQVVLCVLMFKFPFFKDVTQTLNDALNGLN